MGGAGEGEGVAGVCPKRLVTLAETSSRILRVQDRRIRPTLAFCDAADTQNIESRGDKNSTIAGAGAATEQKLREGWGPVSESVSPQCSHRAEPRHSKTRMNSEPTNVFIISARIKSREDLPKRGAIAPIAPETSVLPTR